MFVELREFEKFENPSFQRTMIKTIFVIDQIVVISNCYKFTHSILYLTYKLSLMKINEFEKCSLLHVYGLSTFTSHTHTHRVSIQQL